MGGKPKRTSRTSTRADHDRDLDTDGDSSSSLAPQSKVREVIVAAQMARDAARKLRAREAQIDRQETRLAELERRLATLQNHVDRLDLLAGYGEPVMAVKVKHPDRKFLLGRIGVVEDTEENGAVGGGLIDPDPEETTGD